VGTRWSILAKVRVAICFADVALQPTIFGFSKAPSLNGLGERHCRSRPKCDVSERELRGRDAVVGTSPWKMSKFAWFNERPIAAPLIPLPRPRGRNLRSLPHRSNHSAHAQPAPISGR
jgi:hypothetical protein